MPQKNKYLAYIAFAAPLLLLWGWGLFYISSRWNATPDAQLHWIIIPLVLILLCWRQWPVSHQYDKSNSPSKASSISLYISFALLLVWISFRPPYDYYVLFSWLYLLSLLVFSWNYLLQFLAKPLAKLWLPISLLLFLSVPLPNSIGALITGALQDLVVFSVSEILNAIGIGAIRSGRTIVTSPGVIGINDACSGIRSLQTSIIVSLFFGFYFFDSAKIRIKLLLGSLFTVVAFNIARASILIGIANMKSVTAMNALHDNTGYSVMIANVFVLSGLTTYFIFKSPIKSASEKAPLVLIIKKGIKKPLRSTLIFCSLIIIAHLINAQLMAFPKSNESTDFVGNKKSIPFGSKIIERNISAYKESLKFDQASDIIIRFKNREQYPDVRIYNACWNPGTLPYNDVAAHLPITCFRLSGWTPKGEHWKAPIKLRGKIYSTYWQILNDGRQTQLIGFLHLVGNHIRPFEQSHKGILHWQQYYHDIANLFPKPQEIFIFTSPIVISKEHSYDYIFKILDERFIE